MARPALLTAAVYMTLAPVAWTLADWRMQIQWTLPETLAAWVVACGLWMIYRRVGAGGSLLTLTRTVGLAVVASALIAPVYFWTVMMGQAQIQWSMMEGLSIGCVALTALAGLAVALGVPWGLPVLGGSMALMSLLSLALVDEVGWISAAWATMRGLTHTGLVGWLWVKVAGDAMDGRPSAT